MQGPVFYIQTKLTAEVNIDLKLLTSQLNMQDYLAEDLYKSANNKNKNYD